LGRVDSNLCISESGFEPLHLEIRSAEVHPA
jgi:hypothetical protein